MIKIYTLLAAAALVAGAIVAPGLSAVSANTRVNATETTQSAKGDRLDIASRVTCKEQSWPNIGRACLTDLRVEAGAGKQVRVVTTNRK